MSVYAETSFEMKKNSADLAELQDILGISFRNISYLKEALIHSSLLNENVPPGQPSNERLEFLGDAVLGLVVTEKLYRDYPAFDEGEMTRRRASLVRRETLARLAENLRLGTYLYMGKGEEAGGGRHKPANLASGLEAVIGAVFLDQGLAQTGEFVLRLFATEFAVKTSRTREIDYKSELQETVQSHQLPSPTYSVVESRGPEHSKTFMVEVKVGQKTLGNGTGRTKKAAEADAARMALEQLPNGFASRPRKH